MRLQSLFSVRRIFAALALALCSTTGWAGIETTIISFDGKDGNGPYAGLIFDKAGNLYGTTMSGGSTPAGTVFELSPNGDGTWTESVPYSFRDGRDGNSPMAGLVFDRAGNLYGTTLYGGIRHGQVCSPSGCGTVFELSPLNGGWTEKVLYRFTG